jgi:hypothetical protein
MVIAEGTRVRKVKKNAANYLGRRGRNTYVRYGSPGVRGVWGRGRAINLGR